MLATVPFSNRILACATSTELVRIDNPLACIDSTGECTKDSNMSIS